MRVHCNAQVSRSTGANSISQCESHIEQKLCYASIVDNTAEAKRLVAMRAPVDLQNSDGTAPLHGASAFGHVAIVGILIENKADLNIADKNGYTPLIWAARTNKMITVRTLVQAGAEITIRSKEDKTAAEQAKKAGNYSIAEYLDHTTRFHRSVRNKGGQLHHHKGRSLRAVERDLKESGVFVNHLLHRLKQFCMEERL